MCGQPEESLSRPRAVGAKAGAKVLEIRVGPPGDALDRFEAAWNRVAEGRKISPLRVLSLQNLPLLLKTMTPARWQLIERLKKEGPVSIYELAKRLERNYKNVHTDVAELMKLGLIEKNEKNEIGVAWDVVRAELRF
jgi:predicted transcriptional regulator